MYPCECPSGRGRRAGLRRRDWGSTGGGCGVRAPAPPLAGAAALRSGPACAPADPSFALLACGRSGARARPRAGRGEAVAPGARPQTCQTRVAGLELRAWPARGRRRSLRGPDPSCASRPRRAGQGRGDERRPRGSAPGRRAAPSRSPGASGPARAPAARGFGTWGQCWGAFNL